MDATCAGYGSQASCVANTTRRCAWSAATSGTGGSCYLGASFESSWLRNTVYCPNSKADQAATCAQLVAATTCNATSICQWQTTAQLQGSLVIGSFLEVLKGFTGTSSAGVSGGACAPKWLIDPNAINDLITKITAAATMQPPPPPASAGQSTGQSSQANSFLLPIFNDLFGNCSGVTRYRTVLLTCPGYMNKTACEAATACAWTATSTTTSTATSSTTGVCDIGATFATDLLLDPTDPWVSAIKTATTSCSSKTTAATCTAVATITVDPAKYTDFSTAVPLYTNSLVTGTPPPPVSSPGGGGAGSRAALPPLLLSVVAALACLFALLL